MYRSFSNGFSCMKIGVWNNKGFFFWKCFEMKFERSRLRYCSRILNRTELRSIIGFRRKFVNHHSKSLGHLFDCCLPLMLFMTQNMSSRDSFTSLRTLTYLHRKFFNVLKKTVKGFIKKFYYTFAYLC